METEQLEKRLSWLDEQRRKDADSLGRLFDRMDSLEASIENQSRQLQEAATELARLNALSTRISQFDEALEQHRKEVSRRLEGFSKRQEEVNSLVEASRSADREETSKAIEEVRLKLGAIPELQQDLEVRRSEELRLTRELDSLEKGIDELKANDEERARAILSVDEMHMQYNRRISELQAEGMDVRTKIDTVRGLIDAVEDRARRLESRVAEVSTGENERREAQALWIDQQALKLAEFEKGWKEWVERFQGLDEKAVQVDERMQSYDETYRNMRHLQDDLSGLVERLERRINEIVEIQRLAEERIRQEWTSFQADDQKRWNTYKLTYDEQWREHERLHEKLEIELRALDENMTDVLETIGDLGEVGDRRIKDLLVVVREWAAEIESRSSDR